MTPSPFSRLASATVTGLVSIAAQSWAGVKTFTSAIIASAGVQLGSLWNTNGTGASDVGVKVGLSTADGSVNASARLAEFGTGIGGTEVAKSWIRKAGSFVTKDSLGVGMSSDLDNVAAGLKYNASANLGVFSLNGAAGIWINLGTGRSGCSGHFDSGSSLNSATTVQINTSGSARPTADASTRGTFWYSRSAGGAADTIQVCLKSAADTYSWVTIGTG